VAGVFSNSIEAFFSSPLHFAERKQRGYGKQYPADACGTICLAFRVLAKFS
jgi:hypothetical protein